MMVRVFRPRMSIFSRPMFSTSSFSKWVVMSSRVLYSGMNSVSLRGAMTTPAACLPVLRMLFSRRRA